MHNNKGITLIELLVVLAILAVLATVLPGFKGLIDNHQQRKALNNLYHAFSQARSTAITSGVTVTLCPLDTNNVCTTDWNRPIALFLDPANERRLSANTNLRYQIPAASSGILIARPYHKSYFQYRPDGTVRGTIGNITWCPNDGELTAAGQLIVNMGGRVRHARDLNGNGIVQGSNGQSITCP
ncbi:MAG: GspH/FimT family pseudopilin [Marinobacter sp.]|nr:GspH/FimT family pseudopilin [Marinobacter sp.]